MNIQNMDEIIDGFIENIVLKSTAENPLWNREKGLGKVPFPDISSRIQACRR